jgi:outer membrane receptor protein involved in Fe transport
MAFFPLRILAAFLSATILLFAAPCAAQNLDPTRRQYIAGVVKDSLGRPVARSTITLKSDVGRIVAVTTTDDHGLFKFKQPRAGTYSITAQSTDFRPATVLLMVPQSRQSGVEITLESKEALSLPVTARVIRAQNGVSSTGTNKYTLLEQDITNLPQGQATPLNQVMLQMPGVALDQNQEIHVRGEHMGIQYQMNGIMLPLDLNTDPTFTQLLNSYFVRSVSLLDGVLPARYGYRTSGIIDIHTRDGCDDTHNSATVFGGQRDTAQGSFELGGCGGAFSYYLTGLFLQSNLGFSSAVPAPDPIHDAVTQGQGFAYVTYNPAPTAKLSLISGMTLAFNQFPNQPNQTPQYQLDHVNPASYPSSAINSGLNQQDYFGVLALNGTWGSDWGYQLAYSVHYNAQTFYPDPIGDLIYQGVASNVLTSDLSNSLEGDLTYHIGAHVLRGGFYLGEYGVESDQTSQVFPIVMGVPATAPISLRANLNKINLVYGIYFEDTWQITDRLSVNLGSRWDRVTGFAVDSQFSPTINFVYKPRADTVLHAGFARNFQIPNFQNVSSGISMLFAGTTGAVGTSPGGNTAPFAETDYTWDTGFTHRFSPQLVFANDNYFRIDRHYLDEGQFGFVPIDAPFNYVRGYGGGTEESLTYNLERLALRLNLFIAREEDVGVASGQYNFPPDELSYIDRHYIVLDHTPLVGASGGVAYRWNDYQFAFDGLFSSGLRGGFANQTQLPKVWQFNLSASRDFTIPGYGKLTNRIVLLNIFDRTNLIRPANGIGVFQAAYGPRITVYDALTIPLPSL